MDILAIVLGLVATVGLVIFITQPLRQARHTAHVDSQLDSLLAQRESLYTQIRELDFDHATGKLADEDHAPLRARLVARAADVLRQIDALDGAVSAAEDDALEKAIAARRRRQPSTTASLDAELEAAVAARRKTLTCPNCGKPIHAGDAFCSKCGAPIGAQVAQ